MAEDSFYSLLAEHGHRIICDEDFASCSARSLEDPDTATHLRRTRLRVERLLGVLAYRYGGRKARYKGRSKALMQAAWAATLVNLSPIGAELRTQGD